MRKWARLMIICIILFLVGVVMGMYTGNVKYIYFGSFFIAIAWIIKYAFLICTNCGYRGVSPQWSKNKTYYCVRCGNPIDYGDDQR